MLKSYYSESFSNFLTEDQESIFNKLCASNSHRVLEDNQKNAWKAQIKILKDALKDFKIGQVYFEFSIPRMGKRVDNILIIEDLIFVIEFKVGDTGYQKYAIEQVVDYCLDLQNFHEGSHYEKMIPILVSTKAEPIENIIQIDEKLFEPLKANKLNLPEVITLALEHSEGAAIDFLSWENSSYKPTPTIIEAAQAIYKGHKVKEISRHDAGATNLSKTTDCISEIIEKSKGNNRKSICFLTGVP
jgi:hypothetical protein